MLKTKYKWKVVPQARMRPKVVDVFRQNATRKSWESRGPYHYDRKATLEMHRAFGKDTVDRVYKQSAGGQIYKVLELTSGRWVHISETDFVMYDQIYLGRKK